MPYFVREKVLRALNERGKAIKDAGILVLGVAYKRDIDDFRESPSLKVMELLQHDGARIDYHDPHVPSFTDERGKAWHSIPLSNEALERSDCVVILTDHSSVDYGRVLEHAKLVIDTRNATKTARQALNGKVQKSLVLL
jgi:UDP-N-acetyl-D-glucosamine dehydrogenase